MKKTPAYDWIWFQNHAPFKKILEETCELEIEKENNFKRSKIAFRPCGRI